AQSQLTMGLSHEIRNPLASIRSGLDALSIDPTVEDLKEFLPIAKRTIDRLTNICENMMRFGKSTSHQMAPCNVNEILTDLLYFVRTTTEKTNVHLTLELGEVPSIIGDGASLSQVFTNLINNAIDEMKSGGELLIKTESARFKDKDAVTRDGLVIIIRDTGNGIAPGNLSQIFDSFYSTKYQNMGLGLSISLKIIDEHKGIIHVESELQKGTTFKVYLPKG
ncbi:MAG: ATP-binding protein, partial [Candidatus Margulisiibacteriota bacterium]